MNLGAINLNIIYIKFGHVTVLGDCFIGITGLWDVTFRSLVDRYK